MAVPAKIEPHQEFAKPGDPGYPAGVATPAVIEGTGSVVEVPQIQQAAARLYGQGYKRGQVARILLDHLTPTGRNEEQRLSSARAKLRRWEGNDKFRDLIYRKAVVDLDMEIPTILQGVARKAKRGRVDAARLALEVTNRHNPKGDVGVTSVTVQIANVPRPE